MLPEPEALRDFGPMAERAVAADPAALLRLRSSAGTGRLSGFVRLPYEVLAGRSLALEAGALDQSFAAADFVGWLADPSQPLPGRDASWLAALPPQSGWQRIEVVPDQAVREVVRSGALLARETTSRAGQQSLLSAIVLTVSAGSRTVEVPLGPLSALTRMGFLPRGGEAAIDVASGWIRATAGYGSTYVTDGNPLGLLAL